ncbi:MAG TPA: AsmA family protein [Alphaproteobacteria bacterium]
MSRLARIAAILGAVLVVLILAGVAFLKSDLPRQIAERQASEQLGRAVRIGGLDIDLIPRPRIVVTNLTVANIETGSAPNMVEIPRVEAVLDLTRLLAGQIDVHRLELDQPLLLAEKDAEGRNNWQFRQRQEPTEAAPDFPVRQVVINEARVIYRDPAARIDLGVGIDTVAADERDGGRVAIDGRGRIGEQEIRLSGGTDPLADLDNTEKPYAFGLAFEVGSTQGRIDGTLEEPLRASGLAAQVHLDVQDAGDFYQLTGITIPPTPPYVFDGKVVREGEVWRLAPFEAKIGDSDLTGEIAYDPRGERPKITADLTSRMLDLGDLAGSSRKERGETGREQAKRRTEEKQAAGIETRKPPPKSEDQGVIPETPIDFGALQTVDAAVSFNGRRVNSSILQVEQVTTEVRLENGHLRVGPLRFRIGDGNADLVLDLDTHAKPATYKTVVSLNRLPVGQVVRSFERRLKQNRSSSGTIGGRAEIQGRGNSVQEMLNSAQGELGVAMEQGTIGALFIELAGLDATEALGFLATGNKPIPIRCMIADFAFVDGTMGSRAIVFDTTDTKITGEGAIKFAPEEIFFRFVPQPKDVSLFTGRSPVVIEGTLSDPAVRIQYVPLIARLGLATILGVTLTPLAVPLAFVDVGLGKDSDCAGLVTDIRARMREQVQDGELPEPRSGAPERRR